MIKSRTKGLIQRVGATSARQTTLSLSLSLSYLLSFYLSLNLSLSSTQTHHTPHHTTPHHTAPHRTAPHRTAPHRTAPQPTTPPPSLPSATSTAAHTAQELCDHAQAGIFWGWLGLEANPADEMLRRPEARRLTTWDAFRSVGREETLSDNMCVFVSLEHNRKTQQNKASTPGSQLASQAASQAASERMSEQANTQHITFAHQENPLAMSVLKRLPARSERRSCRSNCVPELLAHAIHALAISSADEFLVYEDGEPHEETCAALSTKETGPLERQSTLDSCVAKVLDSLDRVGNERPSGTHLWWVTSLGTNDGLFVKKM